MGWGSPRGPLLELGAGPARLCLPPGEHPHWKVSKLQKNHLARVFKIADKWINGLPLPLPLPHCFNILSFMSDCQRHFVLCYLPRKAFLVLTLFLHFFFFLNTALMQSMKWRTASMPHQKLRPGTTHCTRAIPPHTHILPHCPRTSACPGAADEVIYHVKHVVQKHPKIQALTWT